MSVVNIIDSRKHKYRFMKINAVMEAAWHDNSCNDADQVTDIRGPDYDEKEHLSLKEALDWADSVEAPVTLYLYDEDSGIYPINRESNEK